jgi:hypothetical protein
MGNLASDVDNPAFQGAVPDNSGLAVKFYKEPKKNEFRSEKEGRPIFEEVMMIHIVMPGNNLFDVKAPVREDHKRRFPIQWAHFQNNQSGDPMMIGTPLEQWPLLGTVQVQELKGLRFYTVESIANASDATLQRVGMAGGMAPFALRDKAIRYLALANDSAVVDEQAAALKQLRDETAIKDAKHAQEMAELQAQMKALVTIAQAPRPRGRPKKVEQAA